MNQLHKLTDLELQMGLYPTAGDRADWENPPAKKLVTNEMLLAELQRSKEIGRITNNFIRLLSLLVQRFAERRNWVEYKHIDEMHNDAMRYLVERQQCMTFKPELSDNPFGYYTQITNNAFCQVLQRKKKERLIAQGKPDRQMIALYDHAMKVL